MFEKIIMLGQDRIAVLDPSDQTKCIIDEKDVTEALVSLLNGSEYVQRVLINACAESIVPHTEACKHTEEKAEETPLDFEFPKN